MGGGADNLSFAFVEGDKGKEPPPIPTKRGMGRWGGRGKGGIEGDVYR